jgi:hypothetical protein
LDVYQDEDKYRIRAKMDDNKRKPAIERGGSKVLP